MNRRAAIAAGCVLLVAGCAPQPEGRRTRPAFVARARAVGRSMLPLFRESEEVAVELCRFDELRARDTVIFWHDRTAQWVHHRLDYRDPTDGRWVTRGDNNPGIDTGRMTADEFIGRTHKLA